MLWPFAQNYSFMTLGHGRTWFVDSSADPLCAVYFIFNNLLIHVNFIAGCGSSGWQAPEQLLHGRQTRAVDLFSLGCVLFFCITGGQHPFGDRLERDINITKNQVDLFLLGCIPEAEDLISRLLNPDPQLR